MKTVAMASAFAAMLALPCEAVVAQTYPAKPVRLIVPKRRAGERHVARLISEKVSPVLGQQIVVDNRGGGGGRIAAEPVARAPRRLHTPARQRQHADHRARARSGPPVRPVKDFAPISLTGSTAYCSSASIVAVKSYVNSSRSRKQAPDQIASASTGLGSPSHLGAGAPSGDGEGEVIHVPFKGGAPAMLSLLQGETYRHDQQLRHVTAAVPRIACGRWV